ncbi:hypothetical protein EV182_004402, partial [Spiromyces aspiralis]
MLKFKEFPNTAKEWQQVVNNWAPEVDRKHPSWKELEEFMVEDYYPSGLCLIHMGLNLTTKKYSPVVICGKFGIEPNDILHIAK